MHKIVGLINSMVLYLKKTNRIGYDILYKLHLGQVIINRTTTSMKNYTYGIPVGNENIKSNNKIISINV